MTKFTRREVLKAGAAAGVAGLLGGCGNSVESVFTSPIPPRNVFPQPVVRQSVGGVLETQFVVDFAENFIGDFRLFTRTYDGTIPGPTLRLAQGETLRLTHVNNLPANTPPPVLNHNRPHAVNTINFHSHGWHVDPGGIADNIFRKFEPQSTEFTEIHVPPTHHEGTFWYHPHHHGGAAEQMLGGMAGLLIVTGPTDEVPEIAAAKEVPVIIQNIRVNENGEVPEFNSTTALSGAPKSFYLVNGRENPTLFMRPGEVQRWRICQASAKDILDVTLEGHTMQQIAFDGLTFPAPVNRQQIVISAGNRTDVMIKAGQPGTYSFRSVSNANSDLNGPIDTLLFTLVVSGEPMDMALPTQLPGTPHLQTITDAEVAASTAGPRGDGKRVVAFQISQNVPGFNDDPNFNVAFRMVGTGETPPATVPPGYDSDAFADFNQTPAVCTTPAILPPPDDKKWGLFDPNTINHTLKLDTVEEWTICGTNHPFHIHVNPFLLVAIDGVPLDPPMWMDTVAPMSRTLTIRMRPTVFTGDAVAHCHILDHEDVGMMQKIRIVE
jgi:FtsP/CotA-like multicopper oxidase with cupredoxin domain